MTDADDPRRIRKYDWHEIYDPPDDLVIYNQGYTSVLSDDVDQMRLYDGILYVRHNEGWVRFDEVVDALNVFLEWREEADEDA